MRSTSKVPRSLQRWLLAAAAYNVVFGLYTLLLPKHYFAWSGLGSNAPNPQALWPCIGMIVAVYGLGYAIAATDPLRHWPIVLVGLIGKILGPLGFLDGVIRGALPPKFGWILLSNDLIWWPSFFAIMRLAAIEHGFNRQSIEATIRLWIKILKPGR